MAASENQSPPSPPQPWLRNRGSSSPQDLETRGLVASLGPGPPHSPPCPPTPLEGCGGGGGGGARNG